MPLPKDPIKAEESRKRMSEASKRKWDDPDYRQRMSEVHTGKKQSKESIEKRTAKNMGKTRSPRIKKNCAFCGKELLLAEWQKNRKFCSTICKGKWQSENAIGENSSHWLGGQITIKCDICGTEFERDRNQEGRAKCCSPRCRGLWMAKNGLLPKLPIMTGENHPQWIGGPKEYCEKFNKDFKNRIRAFFDYKCVECGTPQDGELLHCHHVYYDKKACCNINENGIFKSNLGIRANPHSFEIVGDPNKFVALCRSCHAMTTGKNNRADWARHFENIINNYYLGKSYFSKDEYEKMIQLFM